MTKPIAVKPIKAAMEVTNKARKTLTLFMLISKKDMSNKDLSI
jgi:hypothetical protein